MAVASSSVTARPLQGETSKDMPANVKVFWFRVRDTSYLSSYIIRRVWILSTRGLYQ